MTNHLKKIEEFENKLKERLKNGTVLEWPEVVEMVSSLLSQLLLEVREGIPYKRESNDTFSTTTDLKDAFNMCRLMLVRHLTTLESQWLGEENKN